MCYAVIMQKGDCSCYAGEPTSGDVGVGSELRLVRGDVEHFAERHGREIFENGIATRLAD